MARVARRFLIETDVLIASLDRTDPRNEEARNIISRIKGLTLSPYSLIELNLLIKSGNIKIKDYTRFWHKLEEMMNYYNVAIAKPRPIYHSEASRVRSMYGLTYFDSLHCAVALVEEMILVSYDRKAYERVGDLRYSHPAEVLKKRT